MEPLTLETLSAAVKGEGAAIRVITRLQPAGGPGDKVFPPTYQGGQYVYEERHLDGQIATCVLLDSVQSQANRMEDALLYAWRTGEIQLPVLQVDFHSTDIPQYGTITVLQAPHRVADAILRDSLFQGKDFRESPVGQKFVRSTPMDATGLLEVCPTALVFGTWDSTGFGPGGMGAKFARTVVSEIIGVAAQEGRRAAVRVDPLGIQKRAATIYRAKSSDSWTTNASEAETTPDGAPVKFSRRSKSAEAGTPAVINHSNIITDIERGGVSIRHALQTTVLSLAALRKLHFPDETGAISADRDSAARTYLAALGLCAIFLQQERFGYDLRSRCLLVPEDRRVELVPNRVAPPQEIGLSADSAKQLYEEAVAGLQKQGLPWSPGPITLKPSPRLCELVKSNLKAIAAGATDEED